MFYSIPFILLDELKRRIIICVLLFITSICFFFLFNYSLIEQFLLVNYLFYYISGYELPLSYYNSNMALITYNVVGYYYPEQEYNFSLDQYNSIIFFIEILFLFLVCTPFFVYEALLFLKPALYIHEQPRFLTVKLMLFLVLNLYFSMYLSNTIINCIGSSMQLQLNSTFYMNYNIISLYHYYLVTFVVLCFSYLILFSFFTIYNHLTTTFLNYIQYNYLIIYIRYFILILLLSVSYFIILSFICYIFFFFFIFNELYIYRVFLLKRLDRYILNIKLILYLVCS